MSVLIKGMKMPEYCDKCYIREKDTCPLTKTNVTGWGIPLNCPLVSILSHGRLIDADEFIATIQPLCEEDFFTACTLATVKQLMIEHINKAPTIIPAEEYEI